jgi:hypothetical protein
MSERKTKIQKTIERFKLFFRKNVVVFEYLGLTAIIGWPFFCSGYVLSVDLAWPASLTMANMAANGWSLALSSFLTFLHFFLPGQIIEKFFLFLTIFLAGLGAHRLVESKSEWPKYFAGLLYVLTPFFYSRFIYGQIWLLLAYALLPFFLKSLLKFYRELNWRDGLKSLIFLLLISITSLHFLFFAFFIVGVGFLVYFLESLWQKDKEKAKLLVCSLIIGLCLFVLFSSYWLIPMLLGKGQTAEVIGSFNAEHQVAFLTDNGGTNVWLNVLAQYGFWGDRSGFYVLPRAVNPAWWVIASLICLLSIYGLVVGLKQKERRVNSIIMGMIGFGAVILAVGAASGWAGVLILWLEKIFPLYRGFREPQKWVALLVLSYCYFGGQGLAHLGEWLKKFKKEWVVALAAIFVVIYNPLVFNGFSGQMFSANYPASWASADQYLAANQATGASTLFLPWHQYMSYSFVKNRVVATLPCSYFSRPMICADNMEVGNIYSASTRPFSIFFEKEILLNKNRSRVGEKLKEWKVQYIILAKEVDWQNYDFLKSSGDFEAIKEWRDLILYRNLRY